MRADPPCRRENRGPEACACSAPHRAAETEASCAGLRALAPGLSLPGSPFAATKWGAASLSGSLSPPLGHPLSCSQKLSLNLRHLRKSCPSTALIISTGSEDSPCSHVADNLLTCEVVNSVLSPLVAIFIMKYYKYTRNRDCCKNWPCTCCSEFAVLTFVTVAFPKKEGLQAQLQPRPSHCPLALPWREGHRPPRCPPQCTRPGLPSPALLRTFHNDLCGIILRVSVGHTFSSLSLVSQRHSPSRASPGHSVNFCAALRELTSLAILLCVDF